MVLFFVFFFNYEGYKYISCLLAGTRESKAKCHVYSSVEPFFSFLSGEEKTEVLWEVGFLNLCLWKTDAVPLLAVSYKVL